MSYYVRVSSWAKYFGKENIILRVFENEQYVGGSLFSDFLNAVGLELTNEFRIPQRRINSSMGPKLTEMIRLSNYFEITNRQGFIDFIRENYAEELCNGKHYSFLPNEDRMKLLAKFTEGNDKLASEYLNKSCGLYVDEVISETSSYTDSVYEIQPEELMSLLSKLWNKSVC